MGTPTQKIARQSHSESTPPISRPRNDPATAATMFTPSAIPRWFEGNASVRIAPDDAISIAPPIPWITRQPISHNAPASRSNGSKDSAIAAAVKTTNPRL